MAFDGVRLCAVEGVPDPRACSRAATGSPPATISTIEYSTDPASGQSRAGGAVADGVYIAVAPQQLPLFDYEIGPRAILVDRPQGPADEAGGRSGAKACRQTRTSNPLPDSLHVGHLKLPVSTDQ